jgi:hypothetical protein
MKNIIILLFSLVVISCSEANYKVGEEVCAYGTKVTIVTVHTFAGTAAQPGGANYDCKYTDEHGVIQEVLLYEKEFTSCK